MTEDNFYAIRDSPCITGRHQSDERMVDWGAQNIAVLVGTCDEMDCQKTALPYLHCVVCHSDFLEGDNGDNACNVMHSDDFEWVGPLTVYRCCDKYFAEYEDPPMCAVAPHTASWAELEERFHWDFEKCSAPECPDE
ncbi:hypothetical protein HDU87_003421 [Geranomyces variabilis]|uniref:Uncharacterized protein n=1 Tax=Geranomyces variabilis TaxID=109894 RepID=A0AAD5TKS2_9FUNG|nr:hypothetical protein HDU87_003421 [Geranomyces variabilis]